MATEVCWNFLIVYANLKVINLSINLSSYLSKDIISETKYLSRINIYIINYDTHRYCILIYMWHTQVSNNDAARIYL